MTLTRDQGYQEKLAQHGPLWGDLYALTMSQAFFTNDKHELNTAFHAFIRKNPFGGSYLITGGQNIIAEWLSENWKFGPRETAWMRAQTAENPDTGKQERLFSDDFIDYVANSKLALSIEAMPEGELAFPDEPIYRVRGPLWQCLMVETAILNATNSQSLFATLASRLVEVADGAPILEFGLRRAQAIGGYESSRGAYLGGAAGVSNMEASMNYGIPAAGTFAHAFVMTYEDELDAFREWAGSMPYSGVFLVDTYDTVEGVKKAVQACQEKGIRLKGIRLDSGDLAWLSKQARQIMDEAGFTGAKVVASNDLDEETIASIKAQGGKVDIWGVGTNLATAKAQPALGAVYKLGAVYDGTLSQAEIDATRALIQQGKMPLDEDFVRNVVKLSEDAVKTTIPGELDVLRYIFRDADGSARYNGDTILSALQPDPIQKGALARPIVSVRKTDDTMRKRFNAQTEVYRPLKPFFDQGTLVRPLETIHEARARAQEGLSRLDSTHKRLKNPHVYVVGIEETLYNERRRMIMDLRSGPKI
ncbi:MAG: nicotinate phosphoribosyltransferase [Rhodospirillales bacterium]|nr:nicotinate phosphoribosyltransferase [Rhodospirillales bacterium]MCB9996987.1 nicotinate phosphoribosyltransferase [Rhodospirillales bacterium]